MNNFTERLRGAMDRAGMTQSILAEKSGCSKAAISQYLKGIHTPQKDVIPRLASALEVQPDFLIGLDVPSVSGIPKKISVELAAKCIGVGRDYVKTGLKNGTLDLGSAVLFPSGKWRFEIQPHKLKNYVGTERFNEFFHISA